MSSVLDDLSKDRVPSLLAMAEGSGNETESLFEGMDFILPSSMDYESQSMAVSKDEVSTDDQAGIREGLDSKVVYTHSSSNSSLLQPNHSSSPAPVSVATISPPLLQSSFALPLSSMAHSQLGTLSPPSLLPESHSAIVRAPSEPLDESFFSGLSVASAEDGNGHLHEDNEGFSLGISMSSLDSSTLLSLDLLQRGLSKSVSEMSGNGDKERTSFDSIRAAYNGIARNSSSVNYSTKGGLVQSKTLSYTAPAKVSTKGTPLNVKSLTKPSGRRKKRSMKIGYDREEEDLEDGANRKSTGGDKSITAKAWSDSVDVTAQSSTQSHIPSPVHRVVTDRSHEKAVEIPETGTGHGEPQAEEFGMREDIGTISMERLLQDQQGRNSSVETEARSEELITEEVEPECQTQSVPSKINGDEPVACVSEPSQSMLLAQVSDTEGGHEVDDGTEIVEMSLQMTVDGFSQKHDEELDIKLLVEQRVGKTEDKVLFVKELVAKRIQALQEKSSSASALRKAAAQRRRQAGEKVSANSTAYKELELELNEACEKEDFERADILSGRIAEAERAVEQAEEAFRIADVDFDLTSVKLQEVLELQVSIEAEGARILESLKEEAEDSAIRIHQEAQATADRERLRLVAEEEGVELKKLKISSDLISIETANEALSNVIAESTMKETQEKKILSEQRDFLNKELEDLLLVVNQKRLDIAEYDSCISEVDAKLQQMIDSFEKERLDLVEDLNAVAALALELEVASSNIFSQKQGLEKLLAVAEEDSFKLQTVAKTASEESLKMKASVDRKRAVAVASLQSRVKRSELAEKEKQASADAQPLRQEASAARSALQELTSVKVKLNQEIGSTKQRVMFVEKRVPQLDSEKKLAATSRNFKEAGRLAAEAKALLSDKDAALVDMHRLMAELQKVEEEADVMLNSVNDMDSLLSVKEKEAAMARCERLRLVAAASRDERDAAIELEDFDEAESLDFEAEAADGEADELQELHHLEGIMYDARAKLQVRDPVSVAQASDDGSINEEMDNEEFHTKAANEALESVDSSSVP